MTSTFKHTSRWVAAACLAAGVVLTVSGGTSAAVSTRQVASGGSDTGDCTVTPCATIQYAIGQSAGGDTIQVGAGTYTEDVSVNVAVTLQGAGIDQSVIVGPIGGGGSTIQVLASGVVIDGFTITRAGNNITDWNNPSLNTAGVAVQGLTVNVELRNSKITGMRTAIDVNNSNGSFVHNNIIDNNRTGLIFRNQTDNTVVVENQITNNWTVGVLFLDASLGSNTPVQTALNSTFSNNDISGNWYGQIVDRQTGGSLPAPGLNPKNFSGNWLGTVNPVVSVANSTEPGYSGLIPVVYGGTAVPPGGQPDVAGPASANLVIRPLAKVGTDTDIETTPGRGTFGFQGYFDEVIREENIARVLEPAAPTAYWTLHRRSGAESGDFVVGPDTPPAGAGSFRLQTPGGNDKAYLFNYEHIGTRLSTIDELSYATYQSAATVPIQLPAINVAINPNGPNNQSFATLVFEPVYNPDQGSVQPLTWQTWDAYNAGNGIWWATRDIYDVSSAALVACNPNGALASTPQCAGKIYVTWATIAAAIPNAFITGGVGINQGSGSGGLDASVDVFTIGVPAYSITYDLDKRAPATLTLGNLTQLFDGTPKSVTVDTTPAGLTGVTVTYDGSPSPPSAVGSYEVVASLDHPLYEAPNAMDTLVIVDNRTPQVITSGTISSKTATSPNFNVNAYATSELEITFSASGPCTVTPGFNSGGKTWTTTVDVTGVGTCTITMLQAGDATWVPAATTRSFLIVKANQKITFASLTAKSVADPDFLVTATTTSGLPITFSSTGPCTLYDPTPTTVMVDITGVGKCEITASQPGDATYNAASPVKRAFTISALLALKSLTVAPSIGPGVCLAPVGTVTLNANAPSPTTVTLSSSNTSAATVPLSVVVPTGQKTATFAVTTLTVNTIQTSLIEASMGPGTFSKTITVRPVGVLSVTLTPGSLTGGDSSSAMVTLDCVAPAGGLVINMTSSKPTRATLASPTVFIAEGQQTGSVAITTTAGVTITTAKITAAVNGTSKSATLTINP